MCKDQRRFPRVDVSLPVAVKDDDKVLKGVAFNASMGGLLVESDKPWAMNRLFNMVIDSDLPIEAEVSVVWVLRGGNKYKMGIEFKKMTSSAATAWADFLAPELDAQGGGVQQGDV
ncbi:MAG: PilZ domain-containing protein [Deltaproteobacteria bacterium]|nr:PilZ domain-containing protein [Deltaproteobacteria bacterium]